MATAPPKTAPPQQRRFTVEEYHRMGASGVLTSEDRVQLIDGHIYVMSPIGSQHAACVRRLTRLFFRQAEPDAIVSVQNPIVLSRDSEPEPDIALLEPREDDYASRHPRPEETLFLVEVADSSMTLDRDVKLPLYARAGIPEVWIVALDSNEVHVYREHEDHAFTEQTTLGPHDHIEIVSLPSVGPISTDTILGTATDE